MPTVTVRTAEIRVSIRIWVRVTTSVIMLPLWPSLLPPLVMQRLALRAA
jgi:hypothetical protein